MWPSPLLPPGQMPCTFLFGMKRMTPRKACFVDVAVGGERRDDGRDDAGQLESLMEEAPCAKGWMCATIGCSARYALTCHASTVEAFPCVSSRQFVFICQLPVALVASSTIHERHSTRMTASPKKRRASSPTSLRTSPTRGSGQQILASRLRPGQFVSQRELDLDCSTMPLGAIREMIPRLEAGRLIVTVPKRGLQIAHVDLKLIRNAFPAALDDGARGSATLPALRGDRTRCDRSATPRRSSSAPVRPARSSSTRRAGGRLGPARIDGRRIGNEILSEIYRVNSLHVRHHTARRRRCDRAASFPPWKNTWSSSR